MLLKTLLIFLIILPFGELKRKLQNKLNGIQEITFCFSPMNVSKKEEPVYFTISKQQGNEKWNGEAMGKRLWTQ